jgi:tagatose-6-phosphate ketose/aldose isomerase
MTDSNNALTLLLARPDRGVAGFSYTVAEIAAQPMLWRKTGRLVADLVPQIKEFLGPEPRLLLSGAGSSHFVGMSIAPALRRVFPSVEAIPSTEIIMDPESSLPRENFILVSFARSGDSPEGNAVVDIAERIRPSCVRHIVITCNPMGGLAYAVREIGKRGMVIVLPEGTNDKGLAMTASFTSMALAGLMLGMALQNDSTRCRTIADSLATVGDRFLSGFSNLAAMVTKTEFHRVFFLASRPFFGGALEAHLKVQELSGGAIVAKAEDILGLRHGFMAAIDSESLIVLMFSSDAYRRSYELDLAKEIRRKGLGKMTLVISEDADGLKEFADFVFETGTAPGLDDDSRSIITVLSGQLIGLFASLSLGLKPDSPSPQGIISRVVSGVIIHPYTSTSGVH